MALPVVIRMEHTSLTMPDGATGYLDFTMPEYDDMEVNTGIVVDTQETQVGDLTQYEKHIEHRIFTITFVIVERWTLEKLVILASLKEQFTLYPFYQVYPTSSFTVIWTDYGDLPEQWKRGYELANWTHTCTFREPRGAICEPPS
jgi:hypothetical protein